VIYNHSPTFGWGWGSFDDLGVGFALGVCLAGGDVVGGIIAMNDRRFFVLTMNTQTLLNGQEETVSCDAFTGDLHLHKLVKAAVHHGVISSILPIEIFGHINGILMSPGAEVPAFTEG